MTHHQTRTQSEPTRLGSRHMTSSRTLHLQLPAKAPSSAPSFSTSSTSLYHHNLHQNKTSPNNQNVPLRTSPPLPQSHTIPSLANNHAITLTEQNPRPNYPLPHPLPRPLNPRPQHPKTSLNRRLRNRNRRPSQRPHRARPPTARRVRTGSYHRATDDGSTAQYP
jgi:hypothetical protein